MQSGAVTCRPGLCGRHMQGLSENQDVWQVNSEALGARRFSQTKSSAKAERRAPGRGHVFSLTFTDNLVHLEELISFAQEDVDSVAPLQEFSDLMEQTQ